ncbi:MAG: LEA type 2 family protein [Deltaproteobacteria bacterium]|nr:LEA type 2 family protein [Deltaproteobacteria bacterium]
MRVRILVLLPLVALACAGLPRPIEDPEVKVTGVAVSHVSLAGAEGVFDFQVVNPNGISIPLSAVEWEFAVGGTRAMRGSMELAAKIPARGVAPVRAAIKLGMREAADVAAQVASGVRGYSLRGKLYFTTPLGRLGVGFRHLGELASPI